MGLVNYLSCFLYSILLFYSSCIFACLLLSLSYLFPRLFLIFLFFLLFLISIISNFFSIFSNIPYQIFCYPIHIVVLLYISLVILLLNLLLCFFFLFFSAVFNTPAYFSLTTHTFLKEASIYEVSEKNNPGPFSVFFLKSVY